MFFKFFKKPKKVKPPVDRTYIWVGLRHNSKDVSPRVKSYIHGLVSHDVVSIFPASATHVDAIGYYFSDNPNEKPCRVRPRRETAWLDRGDQMRVTMNLTIEFDGDPLPF